MHKNDATEITGVFGVQIRKWDVKIEIIIYFKFEERVYRLRLEKIILEKPFWYEKSENDWEPLQEKNCRIFWRLNALFYCSSYMILLWISIFHASTLLYSLPWNSSQKIEMNNNKQYTRQQILNTVLWHIIKYNIFTLRLLCYIGRLRLKCTKEKFLYKYIN